MSGHFLAATSSLFGSLLILGLVVTGITMMVAPEKGRELLKILAVALVLFLAGSMLLGVVRLGGAQIAALEKFSCELVTLGAAAVLVVCAFVYPFNQKKPIEWLKRAGFVLIVLLLLPSLVAGLAKALGPAVFILLVLFVSLAAYWVRERRKPRRPVPRRPARPERTPNLPRGGPPA